MKTSAKIEKPYGFWNWGTGIAIAIIVSVSAMIFLVYKSMQVTYDMSEKDYYAAELEYDKTFIAEKNANTLSQPLSIQQSEDFVAIHFPPECMEKTEHGAIYMYRPSSEKLDISIPFQLKDSPEIYISKKKFIKGLYVMKATWEMNGKQFSATEQFFIQKP